VLLVPLYWNFKHIAYTYSVYLQCNNSYLSHIEEKIKLYSSVLTFKANVYIIAVSLHVDISNGERARACGSKELLHEVSKVLRNGTFLSTYCLTVCKNVII
jgi:hypothetical protein